MAVWRNRRFCLGCFVLAFVIGSIVVYSSHLQGAVHTPKRDGGAAYGNSVKKIHPKYKKEVNPNIGNTGEVGVERSSNVETKVNNGDNNEQIQRHDHRLDDDRLTYKAKTQEERNIVIDDNQKLQIRHLNSEPRYGDGRTVPTNRHANVDNTFIQNNRHNHERLPSNNINPAQNGQLQNVQHNNSPNNAQTIENMKVPTVNSESSFDTKFAQNRLPETRVKCPPCVEDRYNDSILIPSKTELDRMSHEDLGTLYHRYINTIQHLCRRIIRMGKLDDGGWEICDDYLYRPKKPCLIYSFGINFDFSFDDDMAKKYQCEVRAFDPSMKVGDHKHGENVWFHAMGIAGQPGSTPQGWPVETFRNLRQRYGHSQRPIDILKIDIEAMEWEVIPNMVVTSALRDVRQFVVEFHVTFGRSEPDRGKYLTALKILKDLYDIGFRLFWTHENLTCKFFSRSMTERNGCNEIFFVNTKYTS